MGGLNRKSAKIILKEAHLRIFLSLLLGIAFNAGSAAGQTSGQAPEQESPWQTSDWERMNSALASGKGGNPAQQGTPALRVKVNLVLVRVIVRDAAGRAVGNLRKEDFQLFDNNRPQTIAKFSIEPGRTDPPSPAAGLKPTTPEPPGKSAPAGTPQRYLALYFDDVHASQSDLIAVRAAADRFLDSALQPVDRAGIFTSSGEDYLDFTDDHARLHEAIRRLQARPFTPQDEHACPNIDPYQGYLIVERRDSAAIATATAEALHCQFQDDPHYLPSARGLAEAQAAHALQAGKIQAANTTQALDGIIRKMAILPGERNLVLVSPGFIVIGEENRETELIDRALRTGITINTLDSRGVYVPTLGGEIDEAEPVAATADDPKSGMRTEGEARAGEVLGDLAYGTGGIFFHNNNDFDQGFRMTGGWPEVSYVLGYSSSNEKFDGRFHTIKVKLSVPGNLSVQARRGYYAPEGAENADARARRELEEAVFSRAVRDDLPMEVHTEFRKVSQADTKLLVMTRVDARYVPFRKEEGRYLDRLVFVTALFDRDGKYINGKEKVLEMRLLDATREKLAASGITMQTSLNAAPGKYLVRMVVRDDEGELLSTQNQTVEIP